MVTADAQNAAGSSSPPAVDWRDPSNWDAALAVCRARYPVYELTIGDGTWQCIDTGAGAATLLLLPGAMGFADTPFHFVLALAQAMRVIAVGYPPTLTDGDHLVDGLLGLLDRCGVAATHVVGGSYSGLVAQRLALHHPQQVASLILANTWAPDPRRAHYFRGASWLIERLPQRLVQRISARYMDHFLPGAEAATHFWRRYFAQVLPAFTSQLIVARLRTFASLDAADWSQPASDSSSSAMPVLLVESSDDTLFGATSQAALRLRYPQAQVTELACRGHAAALTHVVQYVELYRDWLGGLAAPPPTQRANSLGTRRTLWQSNV